MKSRLELVVDLEIALIGKEPTGLPNLLASGRSTFIATSVQNFDSVVTGILAFPKRMFLNRASEDGSDKSSTKFCVLID